MPRLIVTLLAAMVATAAPAAAAAAPAGQWIAGDLHVHTTYSHDSYGGPGDDNTGPDDIYTLGFSPAGEFALAGARGLDFLAISDHNDVRAQKDPGFGTSGVMGVAAYENSLAGHAQMIGARHVFPAVDKTKAGEVNALAEALRKEGGVFQINHPADSTTDNPDDLDWKLGYAVQPDLVEAWNGPRFYQPPFPAANSHDDATKYWEGWLERGARVALSGGSDSHFVATAAAQGVGQPTTWVYVTERSAAGVIEGLRRGRTMVSHQPPAYGSPRMFLEADRDRNGVYETMVGDKVPAGTPLRVRVENAPGTLLRVVTTGRKEAFAPVLVSSPAFEHRFTLPAASTWVRAEIAQDDGREVRKPACPGEAFGSYCRNQLSILAMTSALYLGPDEPAGRPGNTEPAAPAKGRLRLGIFRAPNRSVQARWRPGGGRYDLQVRRAGTRSWRPLLRSSARTSYILRHARPRGTYEFRVRRHAAAGTPGAWTTRSSGRSRPRG
jgi:hypothetical protein